MKSEQMAWLIKRHVVEMLHRSQASHIGSCLSAADILAVLYCDVMRYTPDNPQWPQRDRLVLSKGHASAALYAALAESGFIPREELLSHCAAGSRLFGHVSHYIPGIECSTGSLGHGFPVAAGMAMALRKDRSDSRVYAILGDGECNEGSVWEAAMVAAHQKLDNLTVIIDYNGIQGLDQCDNIVSLSPLDQKLSSFGWETFLINGHDHEALRGALNTRPNGKPKAVVAQTVKGASISFMEDQVLWHYRFPHDGNEYDGAVKELGEQMPEEVTDPYSHD